MARRAGRRGRRQQQDLPRGYRVRPVASRPSPRARSRGWRGLGVVLGEGAERGLPAYFPEDPLYVVGGLRGRGE